MLEIIINEKIESKSDYKYIIRNNTYPYKAFHTKKGFDRFLKISGINLNNYKPNNIIETEKNGKITTYYLNIKIEEVRFGN